MFVEKFFFKGWVFDKRNLKSEIILKRHCVGAGQRQKRNLKKNKYSEKSLAFNKTVLSKSIWL